jgi:hypothetical protein
MLMVVVFAGLLLGVLFLGRSKPVPAAPSPDGRPAPAKVAPPVAALAPIPPIEAQPSDRFQDQAGKCGIEFTHQHCDPKIANILQSNGSGAAWIDYDNDGWIDLYLVNSGPLAGVTHEPPGTLRQPNRLYRNKGDGTFEDVTARAGVAGTGYDVAVTAADYDNDGFEDIYIAGVRRSTLFRNRGNGTFEDVTEKAGVANKSGTAVGAVFFDADGDGRLDLFVANYLTYDPNYKLYFNPDAYPGPLSYQGELNVLFRNRGDGTFEDISATSGVQIPGHRAMSAAAFDYDGDGDQDIYISNDATPNLLLQNDGKGRFKEVAQLVGVAFNAMGEAAGSMAAAIGDCNSDGHLDILVTRLGYGSLYMGSARGLFEDRLIASGVGPLTAQFVGWGCAFFDYDNDSDLDVFIANGDAHYLVGWQSLLLENKGDGTFSDAAEAGGAYFKTRINARGSIQGDYDNDGRLDVLVTTIGGRCLLLKNRGPSGHWLTLDLQGTRSNRNGYGAVVTVTASGRIFRTEARCPVSYISQADRRLHFGLGGDSRAERIEIRWPSGQLQTLENVAADQVLKVKEPGSVTASNP